MADRCHYIVKYYGVYRLLHDTDNNRQFWKEGNSIIAECLDYVSSEGFSGFFYNNPEMKEALENYSKAITPLSFRQRYLLDNR